MSRIPDFSSVPFHRRGVLALRRRRSLTWTTPEGIDVKPVYGAADLEGLDFLEDLLARRRSCAAPTRPYVNQPWTIRQYAGFHGRGSNASTAAKPPAAGQKGLSVAFDLGGPIAATTATIRA